MITRSGARCCFLAVSAGWSARRSQAINVYLLAAVWERPKTGARCSGSAHAVHVWLIPHNPACTPIPGDEAAIVGRVVVVIRRT